MCFRADTTASVCVSLRRYSVCRPICYIALLLRIEAERERTIASPVHEIKVKEESTIMNAYVLTYCTWESYGSVLQSVALKRTLNDLGVSSKIVLRDLAPEFHNKPLFGGS